MLHRTPGYWPAILAVTAAIAMPWVAGCSHSEGARMEASGEKMSRSEPIANRQDQSKETSLATKRWEYASYFNSLKELVRKQWNPAEVYRQRDPNGTVYGQQDRYTLLQVRMNEDGSLADVWVVHTCGLEWLDESELEAFRKAQPFAPPPRPLLRSNGRVEFGFGFFFDVTGKESASSMRLKLFRYRDPSPIPDQR